MNRPATPPQPVPAEPPARQRIVAAARQHFFAHGFRGVTMDDLADELGMSKKTLYAHFPSKVALLETLLLDKLQGVEADLSPFSRQQPADFLAGLHELLSCVQRHTAEIRPPFLRDLQREAPETFQIVEGRRREMIQRHFGKLLAEGRNEGLIRKDIPLRLIVEILLGAVQAVMNPPKLTELGLEPEDRLHGHPHGNPRRRAHAARESEAMTERKTTHGTPSSPHPSADEKHSSARSANLRGAMDAFQPNVQRPTPNAQRPTCEQTKLPLNVGCSTLGVGRSTFDVQSPSPRPSPQRREGGAGRTLNIEHPTSNIERKATLEQRWTLDVGRSTLDVQSPSPSPQKAAAGAKRAFAVAAPVMAALLLGVFAGCDPPASNRVQGYVEGEFVYVASPLAGALEIAACAAGRAGEGGRSALRAGQHAGKGRARRSGAAAGAGPRDLGGRQERQTPVGNRSARSPAQAGAGRAGVLRKRGLRGRSRSSRSNLVTAQELERARSTRDQDQQRVAQLEADLLTARLRRARTRSRPRRPTCGRWKRRWPRRNGTSRRSARRRRRPAWSSTRSTARGNGSPPAGRSSSLLPPANIKVRAFVPEARIGAIRARAARGRHGRRRARAVAGQGEFHFAAGGIHAAGHLQPGEPRQAGLHGRDRLRSADAAKLHPASRWTCTSRVGPEPSRTGGDEPSDAAIGYQVRPMTEPRHRRARHDQAVRRPRRSSTTSICRFAAARSAASSAPTAAARRPSSACSAACCGPTTAAAPASATT